jgi:hypothetical protein
MGLFGTITEQSDFKEVMHNQFVNFVEEERLEFFGSRMNVTIKS